MLLNELVQVLDTHLGCGCGRGQLLRNGSGCEVETHDVSASSRV